MNQDEGRPGTRLDLLAEINRLDVLERAFRSHRLEQKQRLARIARLRARLQERLRGLEGFNQQ